MSIYCMYKCWSVFKPGSTLISYYLPYLLIHDTNTTSWPQSNHVQGFLFWPVMQMCWFTYWRKAWMDIEVVCVCSRAWVCYVCARTCVCFIHQSACLLHGWLLPLLGTYFMGWWENWFCHYCPISTIIKIRYLRLCIVIPSTDNMSLVMVPTKIVASLRVLRKLCSI